MKKTDSHAVREKNHHETSTYSLIMTLVDHNWT